MLGSAWPCGGRQLRQIVREKEVLRASEHLLFSGAVVEAVTVLSKHGYHRAGVAIARSRLGQNCELVKEVIDGWARQTTVDGKMHLLPSAGWLWESVRRLQRCWGIGRAGVAALLMMETGEERGFVYDTDCIKETQS